MATIMINEPDFGLNDFNRPKMKTGNDALVRTLLMICFGRPGMYPSYPEMGLNLQRVFLNLSDSVEETEIKTAIRLQCRVLGDSIDSNEIDVKKTETEEGRIALLIFTPVVDDLEGDTLVIGITTSGKNNIIYNYEIMQSATNA